MRGIRPIGQALLLATLLASCASGRDAAGGVIRPDGAPALTETVIQSGLSVPWDIAFAPDGRMFMTERMGTIVMFASARTNAKRLTDLKVPDVHSMGEAGLMGIALDPRFADNGYLYVCASRMDGGEWRNQILRYKAGADSMTFDRYVIRAGPLAAPIHDGCRLEFGPDGKLWATMGENGNGRLAQDPSSLNGKILRLEPDGTIPADNPILPGASARTYAFSMGHRNPQGLAFQPASGAVFEVEHGATTNDEINILAAGGNYGWPDQEGIGGTAKGFIDPIWTSGPLTYATSGAAFVTGAAWGAWSGSLFVATLKEQDLRRFAVNGTAVVPKEVLDDQKYGRLRSVVQGPDGALYVTTSNGSGDRIIRIAPH
ncbi:MAG TPA: PQQ-dependent sugar dehydrogenase [Candidatus Limnocylindria bacterium]|nr:PQQ-dependent sugar dehydrogenase [Candidatus Limnocylindria bacterium]